MDMLVPSPVKQALLAFEVKRPTTNLIPDPKYQLPKPELKAGFLGVFGWEYSGDPIKTLLKLAISPLTDTSIVSVGKLPRAKTPEERVARKAAMADLKTWYNRRYEQHLEQFVSLKKVNGTDAHFQLSLPVLQLRDSSGIDRVLSLFSGTSVTLTDDARQEYEALVARGDGDELYPAKNYLGRTGLPEATKALFSQCLTGIRYAWNTKSGMTVFLEFKIMAKEAVHMLSTDWLEIRAVDLYPLFSAWVDANFVSRDYGKTAMSLSKIAATLPPHDPDDTRVDQYGLTINSVGEPIWLPKDCNQTAKYESQLTAAGNKEGGVFALRTPATPEEPILPRNIPILVDWVNLKFTYSSSVGKPVVVGLEHMRKCSASAAMNLLRRDLPEGWVNNMAVYAALSKVPLQASDYGVMGSGQDIGQYFDSIIQTEVAHNEAFVARYLDIAEGGTEPELWAPIMRFLKALYQGALANQEVLFERYAVKTVTESMGMLGVVVEYGSRVSEVRAEANEKNKSAINQGLDPNWAPPAAPLITSKFQSPEGGMLPHQAKVRNLLRESPDNAVLSVDAGGGKSMLAITDVLYEIKAHRSAPYLIMCPSHLVANYVSELVEFTDGLVNVIPVTSYCVRVTGLARYMDMLATAPINTVLVVDYDVLKFRAKATVYGTATTYVYPVIEALRKFKPGYAFMDESHYLRNAKSSRALSVLSLIADIPKKRIASGTLNPDSPSDLPGQVGLLDPTILGSRSDFNNTYGEDVRGDRVMKWRQKGRNNVGDIMRQIKGSVVWTSAKRKEWACALPPRKDLFVSVELTEAQRECYNAIFDDMVMMIRKDAERSGAAKKLLEKLEGKKATEKDEEDFGDLGQTEGEEEGEGDILDEEGDVGMSLQPYLADIERFVTDPASHPYARDGFVDANGRRHPPLTGEDLKAPKAVELANRLKSFLDTHKSKALVFVNYNASAESLFKAMPPELQECGLLYSASEKTEHVNRFKTDPKIRWMIGIRKSLEVGLNLQVAGLLCRLEGTWTPGEQEQGDSRIERPYFGPGGDKRDELLFITLVANQTIDITKAARLRAKIVALAKFENSGNPAYDAIEDIPIIPMTLNTIQTQNDFQSNLLQYAQSMAQLNQVTKDENAEYKAKITAEGGFHFTQVPKAANPASAAILARVPYAQGTELYKASELGLVRVDNFLGTEVVEGAEDEVMEEEEEGTESEAVKEAKAKIMGLRCHTEFGDGVIVSAAQKNGEIRSLRVKLDDGTTVRALRVTNVFIITRTETNSTDMRNKLAQAAGLTVTAPITAPSPMAKKTTITQKELREQERQAEEEKRNALRQSQKLGKKLSIGLELSMLNGYMRLSYVVGKDTRAVKALEALGFSMDPAYYYTRIKNYRVLIKQAQAWAQGGFETSSQVDNDTFQILVDELSKSNISGHRHYDRMMSKAGFKNYLRTAWKATADKKMLNMFAIVTDGGDTDAAAVREAERNGVAPNYGVAYLCLPAAAGQPASKLAISTKYKVPGVRWMHSDSTLSVFVNNIQGAHKVINSLLEAGIQITNKDELNKAARSVKKVSSKDDETIDVHA